ncbi:nucleotide-sugar transporter-domain-containing protein [Lasiosphaeria miniovina]|uniref:Nucleotide-sugar transporter-domain-containing protein n=1 Tax=Lasiosphaeria miniovina TaxID=1954250 RepID=A0AA40DXW2_9PEZI|nr:nucleotide-sugar transporter-domain-containing protein [Lasiosphaeria miniovina]KAK0717682.1 nucleotide-sugar transporter-domain-containing protein [Lasiosphaeria miniovina]
MLGFAKGHGDPRRSAAGSLAQAPQQYWQLSVQRTSLILLVLQNSALVMHHSRNSPTNHQPRYLASTAVLLVEIIKLASIFAPDCWKLVVPAALYTLQNSLVYVAISNLDAVTFQVTYQLKILTTVLFSILLLGRSISLRQWLALVLLTLGVALVQISGQISSEDWRERLSSLIRGGATLNAPTSSAFRGFTAVVAASVTSGLTCVYFEKLVKDSLASVSLWTRNVQLSFFSLFPALFIGVLWQDGAAIARDGFFAGYGPIVWVTIALQAFGGLVVAVCIAYADNVAKNFAASLSIVVSYVATALLFRTPMTGPSTGGAAIVLAAMYLYNSRLPPRMVLLPTTKERHIPEKATKPLLYQLMSPTR